MLRFKPVWASLLTLGVVFTQAILTSSPVYACSCFEPSESTSTPTRTAQERVAPYDAVFLGRVLSINQVDGIRMVNMHVLNTWKGVEKPIVTVRTGLGSGDCGFNFLEGTKYLVFGGYLSLSGNENSREVETNVCSPTGRVANEGEELISIGTGKFPKNGYGKVVTQEDITALGEGKTPIYENLFVVSEPVNSNLVTFAATTALIFLIAVGFLLFSRRSKARGFP
jgi:hypothetical protein